MLQINTNELRKVYDVELDGHHYKIRKLGAGERLRVAQAYRRIEELTKKPQLGEQEQDESMKLSEDVFNTMISVFDDQEGGKKRDKFFNEADDFVVGEVMKQIFELQNEGNKTTTTTPAEAGTSAKA